MQLLLSSTSAAGATKERATVADTEKGLGRASHRQVTMCDHAVSCFGHFGLCTYMAAEACRARASKWVMKTCKRLHCCVVCVWHSKWDDAGGTPNACDCTVHPVRQVKQRGGPAGHWNGQFGGAVHQAMLHEMGTNRILSPESAAALPRSPQPMHNAPPPEPVAVQTTFE
uniref:Uncharacterized protein n=1 Tax=Eutreptiella gymnastica TaxID=73025 RepID=A0A7S4FT73_9EUGL